MRPLKKAYKYAMCTAPIFSSIGQGACMAYIQSNLTSIATSTLNSTSLTPLDIAKTFFQKHTWAILAAMLGVVALEIIKGYSGKHLRTAIATSKMSELDYANYIGTEETTALNDFQLAYQDSASYSPAFQDILTTSDEIFKIITSVAGFIAMQSFLGSMSGNLASQLSYSSALVAIDAAIAALSALLFLPTLHYISKKLDARNKKLENFDGVSNSCFNDRLKTQLSSISTSANGALRKNRDLFLEEDNKYFSASFLKNGVSIVSGFLTISVSIIHIILGFRHNLYASIGAALFYQVLSASLFKLTFYSPSQVLEKVSDLFFEKNLGYFNKFIKASQTRIPDFELGRHIEFADTGKSIIKLSTEFCTYKKLKDPENTNPEKSKAESTTPEKPKAENTNPEKSKAESTTPEKPKAENTNSEKSKAESTFVKIAKTNAELNIKKGQIYHLIGTSGSGKSTLTFALFNQTALWNGTITYNTTLKNPETNRVDTSKFQYITPAGFTIIKGMTLFEFLTSNMKQDQKDSCRPTIKDLLQKFDLQNEFMNKLDTPLSQPSTGQQGRLLMVKAILQNAEVIIIDEALANVDFDKKDPYIDFMHTQGRARKNPRTLIICEHNQHVRSTAVINISKVGNEVGAISI